MSQFKKTVLAAGVATLFSVGGASANPTGATVVQGAPMFAGTPSDLIVNNAAGAIINWQDFSIGSGESTTFNLGSPNAAVLNRVIGPNISQILGSLISDGKVFLINPNGIVFGAGSQVNVGSLIASTLDISNDNFNNNNLIFEGSNSIRNPDGSLNLKAIVQEPGSVIQVRREDGLVALIANAVVQRGIIEAIPDSPLDINSVDNSVISISAGNRVLLANPKQPEVVFDLGELQLTAEEIKNTKAVSLAGNLLAKSVSAASGASMEIAPGSVTANSIETGNGGVVFLKALGDLTGTGTAAGPTPIVNEPLIGRTQRLIDASGTVGGDITIQAGGIVDLAVDPLVLTDDAVVATVISASGQEQGGRIFVQSSGVTNTTLSTAQNENLSGSIGLMSNNDTGVFFVKNNTLVAGSINLNSLQVPTHLVDNRVFARGMTLNLFGDSELTNFFDSTLNNLKNQIDDTFYDSAFQLENPDGLLTSVGGVQSFGINIRNGGLDFLTSPFGLSLTPGNYWASQGQGITSFSAAVTGDLNAVRTPNLVVDGQSVPFSSNSGELSFFRVSDVRLSSSAGSINIENLSHDPLDSNLNLEIKAADNLQLGQLTAVTGNNQLTATLESGQDITIRNSSVFSGLGDSSVAISSGGDMVFQNDSQFSGQSSVAVSLSAGGNLIANNRLDIFAESSNSIIESSGNISINILTSNGDTSNNLRMISPAGISLGGLGMNTSFNKGTLNFTGSNITFLDRFEDAINLSGLVFGGDTIGVTGDLEINSDGRQLIDSFGFLIFDSNLILSNTTFKLSDQAMEVFGLLTLKNSAKLDLATSVLGSLAISTEDSSSGIVINTRDAVQQQLFDRTIASSGSVNGSTTGNSVLDVFRSLGTNSLVIASELNRLQTNFKITENAGLVLLNQSLSSPMDSADGVVQTQSTFVSSNFDLTSANSNLYTLQPINTAEFDFTGSEFLLDQGRVNFVNGVYDTSKIGQFRYLNGQANRVDFGYTSRYATLQADAVDGASGSEPGFASVFTGNRDVVLKGSTTQQYDLGAAGGLGSFSLFGTSVNSAELLGGRYTSSNGLQTITLNNAFIDSVALGNNVTINSAEAISNITGNISLDAGSSLRGSYNTVGDTVISSTGGATLQNDNQAINTLTVGENSTLIIGSGITVLAADGKTYVVDSSQGRLVNQGTLASNGAGSNLELRLNANDVTAFENTSTGVVSVNQGSVTVTNGPLILSQGVLQGVGTINGNVELAAATLQAGLSPGTLTINGDLTLSDQTTTVVEIFGAEQGTSTGYDFIQVNGVANLAGTLATSTTNFVPTGGQVFNFLQANSVNGTFGTFSDPAYAVQYTPTQSNLISQAVAPPVVEMPPPVVEMPPPVVEMPPPVVEMPPPVVEMPPPVVEMPPPVVEMPPPVVEMPPPVVEMPPPVVEMPPPVVEMPPPVIEMPQMVEIPPVPEMPVVGEMVLVQEAQPSEVVNKTLAAQSLSSFTEPVSDPSVSQSSETLTVSESGNQEENFDILASSDQGNQSEVTPKQIQPGVFSVVGLDDRILIDDGLTCREQ